MDDNNNAKIDKKIQEHLEKYKFTIHEPFKQTILDVFDEKIVANNDLKEYENMDNFSDLLVSFGLFEQFVNKNNVKAILYYLKAIKLNNCFGFVRLGRYYLKQNLFDIAEPYFLILENYNNVNFNYFLGNFYHLKFQNINNKIDQCRDNDLKIQLKNDRDICFTIAISHYEKGFDKNDIYVKEILLHLGFIHERFEKYDDAELYYKKLLAIGSVKALEYLADMYKTKNKYNKAVEIYADVIKNNMIKSKQLLKKYLKIETQYIILSNIENPNEHITNEILSLQKIPSLLKFINNINYSKKRKLNEE